MKNHKIFLSAISCITIFGFMASCARDGMQSNEVVKDCSSVFESRYVGGKMPEKNKMKNYSNKRNADAMKEKPAVECKILELKFDNNTSCEFVGSNKIEDFSQSIVQDRGNRLILIAPQEQARELINNAQKFVAAKGFDLNKYMETDLFKNLDFPYKGMRCEISGKKVVMWSGKKQVIVTLE